MANREANSHRGLTLSPIHPYGSWFAHHFKNESMHCITFNCIFAVSKDNILKRSREFYQHLLREVDYPQSESGHYMERSWSNIVSIPNSSCFFEI
jgi:hypothetical protein